MKKFIIAMLCVAVLFGFAACDNSSNTPADETDDSVSTPVSEASQLNQAAAKVVALLYEDDPEVGVQIDVVDIIKKANEYNSVFDATNGTLTITRNYSQGGPVVGTVTVVLSGQYTEPTSSAAADGKLDVDDYTVSASNLQVIGESGDYETVAFSVTAPVQNVSIAGIKADGTYTTFAADTAKIYAPLPDQASATSITMPVIVSYTGTGNNAVPAYETKTFGADIVTVLKTNEVADPQTYIIGTVIGADSGSGYLAVLKNTTNLGSLIAEVNKVIDGDSSTTANNKLTNAVVNWVKDSSKSDATNDVGTVTVAISVKEFAMGAAKVSGDFTLTFDGERAVAGTAINLSNLVITGSVDLAGIEYPITIVSDEDYPITAADLTGMTATLSSTTSTTVNKLDAGSLSIGDLTGIADVEGITYELPKSST